MKFNLLIKTWISFKIKRISQKLIIFLKDFDWSLFWTSNLRNIFLNTIDKSSLFCEWISKFIIEIPVIRYWFLSLRILERSLNKIGLIWSEVFFIIFNFNWTRRTFWEGVFLIYIFDLIFTLRIHFAIDVILNLIIVFICFRIHARA